MKISKVEIQAFRAYDELKDCTFDFTLANGGTADFISLYAPNGFGKTSFYDAVEWGITANIYRFIRQNRIKAYASDEKHLNYELANKKTPQFILRNKHSPPDRESFVRLHLLDQPQPRMRNLKKGRVDSTDYHFDDKQTEEAKFRDVILSQDNIDTFLREDDPGERYDKFMNLFGDAELNRIYTNVLCLLKVNENRIEQLDKEIEKLQDALPKEVDDQVLEKINLRITELVNRGEQLRTIQPDFLEEDFLDFSNQISERSVELQTELGTVQNELDQLRGQQLRTDEIVLLKRKRTNDHERLKVLQDTVSRFEDLTKARNRMAHVVLALNQAAAEHKEAEEVLRQFPLYMSRVDLIGQQVKETDNQKLKIVDAEKELTNITNLLTAAQAEMNRINSAIYDLSLEQSDLPGLEKMSGEIAADIKNINEQLKTLLSDIEKNEQAVVANTEQQRLLTTVQESIARNDFNAILPGNVAIETRLTRIRVYEEELKKVNLELKAIESEIASQTNLNNELKQLVLLSSAFINKNQTNACPVCLHEYGNYEQLSERILKNPLLNGLLQQKVADRDDLNTRINSTVNSISELKKEIQEIVSKEIANLKSAASRSQIQKGQLNNQVGTLRDRLQGAETRQRDIFVKINGESFTVHSETLRSQLEQQQKSAQERSAVIAELQKKLEEQKIFVDTWRKSIQTIETGIRAYRLTEEYINVDQFLRKKGLVTYGLAEITALVDELQQKLNGIIEDEKLANEQIRGLSEELKNHNEIKVRADIEALNEQLGQNNDTIRSFEQFLNRFLSRSQASIIDGREAEILAEIEREKIARSEQIKALLEELEKIDGFKNNVMPMLRFTAGRKKIAELSNRSSFLKGTLNERLVKEKGRLAGIIDEQIQSFFYEDLINQLYRKIDPHPSYKAIKFKCDFNDNKPKLNVFVTGTEEEHIIPNLYFSTAQTNILSLSIFLAKALNARSDDEQQINCIFIDDPIQSLDSINILSTIDLIRSLVVNFGKQIILSTHDENFYNLLQKKMPSEKFNSKFLELETFGKVKEVV